MQNTKAEINDTGDRDKYKGDLTYICVNYLRTSVENGTGEYLIKLYDDTYYYDEYEVEGNYRADYRQTAWKADTEFIMSNVIRAKKYEVKDFLREYLFDTYVKLMPEVVEDSIERIRELESYQQVRKGREVILYYREFYGKIDRKLSLYSK